MGYSPESPIPALFSQQGPEGYEETPARLEKIPSTSCLNILQGLIREAQVQGYHSIKCQFPGTSTYPKYPLWALQYWQLMSFLIFSKVTWANSIAWLESDH